MDLSGLDKHPVSLELLPDLLDRLAREQSEKPWACRPKDIDDLSKGFEDVSYKTAANAVDKAAWFFANALGRTDQNTFPVVAYMGPPDFRYCFLPIALVKCGYQILLLSDLSSGSIREYLLEASNCKVFAYGTPDLEDKIPSDIRRLVVPDLEEFLSPENVKPYPYTRTTKEGLNDPLMTLHTSGTSSISGKPKLVRYPLGAAALVALALQQPPLNGKQIIYQYYKNKRLFSNFRISHAGGIFISYLLMYSEATVVLGGRSVSLATILQTLDGTKVDIIKSPPIWYEVIAKDPNALKKLSRLEMAVNAGGILKPEVGNQISKYVQVTSVYGSTESFFIFDHVTDPDDWQYWNANVQCCNIDWRRHPPENPESNMFEPVVVRNPDPVKRHHQMVFWTFSHEKEWPMGDLFEPHPTKPNHWKFISRKDQLIVLGNGINVMPNHFEKDILEQDPSITKAVMYGEGRAHLALLIEPSKIPQTDQETHAMKEKIWSTVQNVNEEMSKGSQVAKHAIVLSTKGPLPRAGKGDIQRKVAERLYKDELEQAFEVLV